MHKTLLSKNEIFDVIVNCYQSDRDLISKFHVVSGSGLSSCVDRTVSDFINNDINIYSISDNNQFIGYFGESEGKFLNGFFIMPERRKSHKNKVWKMIQSHFNNDFKAAIYSKNSRAVKFLTNNGGILEDIMITNDGIGQVFNFVKENT